MRIYVCIEFCATTTLFLILSLYFTVLKASNCKFNVTMLMY
jgi:hypothetical protein